MKTQIRPEITLTDQSMIGWYSLTCMQRAAKASAIAMDSTAHIESLVRNKIKCNRIVESLSARQDRINEMIERLLVARGFFDTFPFITKKTKNKIVEKYEKAVLLYERIETQIQLLRGFSKNYDLEERIYLAKIDLVMKKLGTGEML